MLPSSDGVCHLLLGSDPVSVINRPANLSALVTVCRKSLTTRAQAKLKSMTVRDFFQLVEIEGGNYKFRISADGQRARILIDKGKIVRFVNESGASDRDALLTILAWTSPQIELWASKAPAEPKPLHLALQRSMSPSSGMPSKASSRTVVLAPPPNSVPEVDRTTKPPPLPVSSAHSTHVVQANPPPLVGDINTPPPLARPAILGEVNMATLEESLAIGMSIPGAIAIALVDYESGMCLGSTAINKFPIEVAAAGNTEVVRAKTRVMKDIGVVGGIDDILITLKEQYHLIRPLTSGALFVYLAMGRADGNLALARHKLSTIGSKLEL